MVSCLQQPITRRKVAQWEREGDLRSEADRQTDSSRQLPTTINRQKGRKSIGERERERERDRQTDRQTDRQRHRQTDRQTDRDRERDREREITDRQAGVQTESSVQLPITISRREERKTMIERERGGWGGSQVADRQIVQTDRGQRDRQILLVSCLQQPITRRKGTQWERGGDLRSQAQTDRQSRQTDRQTERVLWPAAYKTSRQKERKTMGGGGGGGW